VGVSYGAWLTLLTALLAEHLDFLIAVVPPVDIVRMLHDGGTMVRGIRRGIGFGAINAEELARLARPVVPSHWKPKLAADRIVLHAARYDRFVPCKGIEELAGRWGTRLVVHNEAHYRLAVSPQITPLVASQVLELSGKAHPTIFA
jgi:hypothetical protein